jgi:hypothetical protein
MLKRNIGHRVQLQPAAIHLDRLGRELPCPNEDWIIVSVGKEGIRLDEANQMGLTTVIGTDAVHHYTGNPSRSTAGGLQYGFLMLTLQMVVRSGKIDFLQCERPGVRVPPPSVRIVDLAVDMHHPEAIGLQQRLEAEGYRTRWARESRVATLEREGWEVVAEPDAHGMPTRYHVVTRPENAVYMKTREPDLEALAESYRRQPGLVSLGVDAAARALVFRFNGPDTAHAFWMKMGIARHGPLHCTIAPGRVDTVIGTLTEAGWRALSPDGELRR